jgi:hypothetical protein
VRRFLYFIPNARGVPDLKRIRAAGLGHAFDRQGAAVETGVGPENMPGCIIATGDGEDLAHLPQEQVWSRIASGSWVGMSRDKAKQPRPADLRHETQTIDGHPVLLGDENEWIIPVLRFANGDTRFPQVMRVGEDGNAFYETKEEFRVIFELATQIVNASLMGDGARFSPNDHMMLA